MHTRHTPTKKGGESNRQKLGNIYWISLFFCIFSCNIFKILRNCLVVSYIIMFHLGRRWTEMGESLFGFSLYAGAGRRRAGWKRVESAVVPEQCSVRPAQSSGFLIFTFFLKKFQTLFFFHLVFLSHRSGQGGGEKRKTEEFSWKKKLTGSTQLHG